MIGRQDDKVTRWQGDKVTVDNAERSLYDAANRATVPYPVILSSGHPVILSSRQFAPGSEWLYAKLYTGTATADQVLREVIGPVVRASQASGALDQWFFLRYSDPDWHLRVRLHGDPQRLMSEVLPALHAAAAPLLEAGQLWRIQLDTYTREVERYGGPLGMALAEHLFHADSEAVLAIVERLAGDAGADARWRLTLRGIDLLLQDLGFDSATQHRVIRQVRESFAAEFRVDKHFTSRLAEKYRNDRKRLDALFDPIYESAGALAPGFALLHQRSAALAPVVEQLRAGEAAGQLAQPLTSLAASYIHMHANRLLRSAQRAQELVLYDFLDRTYESRLARARQSPKPQLSIHRHPAPSSAVVLPLAAEMI
jgi:thiopeptide-type bacteriocin biosynthesis protein